MPTALSTGPRGALEDGAGLSAEYAATLPSRRLRTPVQSIWAGHGHESVQWASHAAYCNTSAVDLCLQVNAGASGLDGRRFGGRYVIMQQLSWINSERCYAQPHRYPGGRCRARTSSHAIVAVDGDVSVIPAVELLEALPAVRIAHGSGRQRVGARGRQATDNTGRSCLRSKHDV